MTTSSKNINLDPGEIQEAFEALLLELRRFDPDDQLKRRLVALRDALAPLLEGDEEPRAESFETARAREAAGLSKGRPEAPRRNDWQRLPAGYRYEHGRLRSTTLFPSVASSRTNETLKAIVLELGTLFDVPGDLGGATGLTFDRIQFDGARANAMAARKSEKIERIHRELFGYPFGQRWIDLLTTQLERQAENLKQRQLQEKSGEREPATTTTAKELFSKRTGTTLEKIATAEEIHESLIGAVARAAEHLPSGVTVAVVASLLDRLSLGGGSRDKKKTARVLVEELVATLEKLSKSRPG